MPFRSIRTRLTVSIAALLAIFIAVSASAVLSLVQIEHQIASIDDKWLACTHLLGDLKNTVSEFRVAEDYRFLASDQPGVIQAEFLAEHQAAAVEALVDKFRPSAVDTATIEDLQHFEMAWRVLLAKHRASIDEAGGEPIMTPGGYGTALQKRYDAVQLAATSLIEDGRRAADIEMAAARDSATRATTLLLALSVAAGLFAIGLVAHAERSIARPLSAITSAMVRLADGDRVVQVPELHRHDEIGAMATAFDVFRRNAVALAEAQERTKALATQDALTGLANRRRFSARLAAALDKTGMGLVTTVILIDLDRFKPINDLYGHAMGDLVLCEVTARLRRLIGIGTLVARLGGDEFAMILPASADRAAARAEAEELSNRILGRLTEVMTVRGTEVAVGASLGLAMIPDDGATAENILRAADLAMYRAKADGRGTFRWFEPAMDAELRDRADLEADVRGAVAHRDIQPFYQPVVELASGRIVGYEVLARWTHPQRGAVPPTTFIPLLEQIGALTAVTDDLLRRALDDARAWPPGTTLAINASPRQLQEPAFPALIANALLAAGFQPGRLEIEVTETALLDDLETAKASIEALRALGIRVVLDDFGTGYSSLSYLRELKFDKIKIDRSFIGALADSPDCGAIVDAVLGLARNLGMAVVAEGIETAETARLLEARSCAFGQGFLFSPAVPAADLTVLAGRLRRDAA